MPSPDADHVAVRLDGVGVSYGDMAALVGVDLAIEAGRLTVLAGPNGAGKSTLIEVVAGVRAPTSGRVGRGTSRVAFVPQGAVVSERLPVTVTDVVTMGAWGGTGPWRRVGAPGRRRVSEALELLGLVDLARRPYAALSGGERQRTLLAQGLVREADLLLLDEPTTGLDAASARTIRDTLGTQVARGTTVVCVSHEPGLLALGHRVVRLEGGRVVGGATSKPTSRCS